jgi:hypothetical protein
MARPRTLDPADVQHIYAQPKTREAREALAKQYGIHPRSIASIQLGYSYADITGGGKTVHRKLPGEEILRRRYAGESTRSIAESLGTSTGSIRAKIGRYCRETGMPWPKADKTGPKKTASKAQPKPKKANRPEPEPPKPAPVVQIEPEHACTACGQDYARKGEDLCNGCASKVQRVDGFGDGPLPHYEGKGSKAASQMGRKAAQTRWLQANSNAIRKRTEAA